MRRLITVCCILLALAAARADDKAAAKTAAEQFQLLVDQAEQEGRSRELGAQFIALALAHPQHPVAVDSLVWVVANLRRGSEASQAITLLVAQHANSARIGPVCARLVRKPSRESESLLRMLANKNPHKEVQAQACFHLAAYLKEQMRLSRTLKEDPDLRKRYAQFYGKQLTNHLATLEEASVTAEVERLWVRIAKSFGKVAVDDDTMGRIADRELFAIRHLSVGRRAPEITGEDIDGTPFKLSDYRGKVVLLDFWGDW